MPTTTYDDPLSDRDIRLVVENSSSVHLSEVEFTALSKTTNLRRSFIQGEVVVKCPIHRTKQRTQLKIMIQQDGCGDSLPVFLFGKSAEECQHLDTRDVIALCGVFVEDNVRRSTNVSPWQIIIDPEKMSPNIWILHRGRFVRSPVKVQSQAVRGPDQTLCPSHQASVTTGPSFMHPPAQVAQKPVSSPRHGPSNMASNASLSLQLPMSPADKTNKQRNYTYTPLSELQEGATVNVYGVINHIRAPAPTRRGTEFSFLVRIVDNSGDKILAVVFFRQQVSEFPDVRNTGDILRLHRVKIEMFNNKLQCCANKGTCTLVFDGTVGAPLVPRSDTKSFTLTSVDIDRVCELRTFYANCDPEANYHVPSLPSNYESDLASCQVGQSFNLICQVVGMCVIRPSELALLQVWDGTRPNFPLREYDLTRERDQGECLNRLVVDEELLAWAGDNLVNINVWDNHVATLYAVQVGDVLKLTGLQVVRTYPRKDEPHCVIPPCEFSLLRGFAGGRGIHVLSPQHPEAIALQQKLHRLSVNTGASQITNSAPAQEMHPAAEEVSPMVEDHYEREEPVSVAPPSQAESETNNVGDTVTVLTAHHDRPVSKLKDVTEHSAPYKFRVQCQVKEYLPVPEKPLDLVKLYCKSCNFITEVPENNAPETIDSPIRLKTDEMAQKYSCPHCSSVPSTYVLDYTIMLQFLLEDDTDSVVAGLWRSDAEDFFNGTTASDILLDNNSFEFVRSQLERVCSTDGQELDMENNNSEDNGPLADCCLKSYTTATGTHYQIFATCVAWSDLDTSIM